MSYMSAYISNWLGSLLTESGSYSCEHKKGLDGRGDLPMCNAHNHSSSCTCGWGGEGHLGRSHGQGSTLIAAYRTVWRHRDVDFCSPTACPLCGARVFFVRHNGGSVWFDEM